jgi:hypothetical protein
MDISRCSGCWNTPEQFVVPLDAKGENTPKVSVDSKK